MSDKPQGYAAAIRYCTKYNRHLTNRRVRDMLDRTIEAMRQDKETISFATAGFLVERDGEGDLRVWVDPDLEFKQ